MIQRIGENYEVLRELRRGQWVTVYEARHRILGRRTLIKWLNPSVRSDDEMVGRLQREARLGAAVNHRNVARIHEVNTAQNRPFVAIEWIEGVDLKDVLEAEAPFPVPRALVFARDLLAGLQAIHGAGVIHRDLSPMNVRITPDGIARITDFGLATGPMDTHYTLPGSVIGTPGYLSPEQATGKDADARSDLFSCGVLIYHALTGESPFHDDDLIKSLRLIRKKTLSPLEAKVPELPPGFDDWLARMLAKDPNKRFSSASQALDQLGQLTGDLPGASVKTRLRARRQRRWWWLAGAVAVVAVSSWMLLQPPPGERSIPPVSPGTTGVAVHEAEDTLVATSHDSLAAGYQETDGVEVLEVDSFSDTTSALESPELVSEDTALRTADTDPPEWEEVLGGEPPETTTVPVETLATRLTSGEGWLKLTSRPWAEVYLNDAYLGNTPGLGTVRQTAGPLRLTLDNPGFPPISLDTALIGGDTLVLAVDLLDRVGAISFRVIPWARVYIDDQPAGETPMNTPIYLSPGRHRIRFEHPEFPPLSDTLLVSAGDRQQVTVDMAGGGITFAIPPQRGQP